LNVSYQLQSILSASYGVLTGHYDSSPGLASQLLCTDEQHIEGHTDTAIQGESILRIPYSDALNYEMFKDYSGELVLLVVMLAGKDLLGYALSLGTGRPSFSARKLMVGFSQNGSFFCESLIAFNGSSANQVNIILIQTLGYPPQDFPY
jgi:hypothetical protein